MTYTSEYGKKKKIYCRLAVLMAEKNPQLSQRQLALETGLGVTTINRLFRNDFTRVDTNTIEILCSYFDCDINHLFTFKPLDQLPSSEQ
ncbi:MAG: helix-turn-helix transcriptional regulator [Prochloraceae cyanobacterium]|nr:helix-turn-helix transcriptional regulator [Prochloraceae cyanobacterium]